MSAIGFGIVMPLLPFYALLFDAEPWQVTLLFSTYSLGQFLGELCWGRLSDRVGRRPILVCTMLCAVGCYLGLAYAPSILIATVVRGGAGFFSGNLSTVQGYIVDHSAKEHLSARLGFVAAAYSAGFVIGPIIGGLLVIPDGTLAGFRPPLIACVGLNALTCACVAILVRENRAGRDNSGPATRGRRPQSLRLDGVMARLLATTFVGYGAWSAMIATLGLWGHDQFGWGPRELGLVIAFTGIAAALSQSVFTRLMVSRFGEVNTIVSGFCLASMALLVQAYSSWEALAALCLLLAGIGHMGAQPCTASLVSKAAPPTLQGTLLGANGAAGALGRIAGPLVAGALFSLFGSRGPLLFASLGVLPAAWLAASAGRILILRTKPSEPAKSSSAAIVSAEAADVLHSLD
jgi:MFS family permease